jgi:hypothetical protein
MSNVHLNLEFAPKARKTSLLGLVFLIASGLLFALAATQVGMKIYENSRQKLVLAETGNRSAAPVRAVAPALRPDPAETVRAQFVRQTSRSLMTPWADLLNALEKAPSNVALLAVEPSAAKRSLSLTAEAASPAQMLAYVQALQDDKHLANVILVSHQVQLQAAGTPIRFQVRASWGEAP